MWRQSAVRASGIEPLREAEFDEFASRIAAKISECLEPRDYRTPVTINEPHVIAGGVEAETVAHAFARRLAEGLNDRLGGTAVFTGRGAAPPRLRCTLRFETTAEDPKSRLIRFQLSDRLTGNDMVAETFTYQARPPTAAAFPTPPAKRKLKIDLPRGTIGALVLQHAPAYRERTVSGEAGCVIFLDKKTWKRLWLGRQRATFTGDGRLLVDLMVRGLNRERSAKLRVIFYDDDDSTVDVTPAIPFRFVPNYTKHVTIAAVSPQATHYVCLIADD
jgi:hypothetical protein